MKKSCTLVDSSKAPSICMRAVAQTPAATNKRQKRKERRAATQVALKRKSPSPVSRPYSVSEEAESRERGPPRGSVYRPLLFLDTTTQQPVRVKGPQCV